VTQDLNTALQGGGLSIDSLTAGSPIEETELKSLAELAPQIDGKRRRRRELKGSPILFEPLRTGLDSQYWWPGLHVIVSAPKAGKSQFVIQQGIHAAKEGLQVAYLTNELDTLDVESRVLGILTGRPWKEFLTDVPDAELTQLRTKHSETLGAFRVYGGSGRAMTVDTVRATMEELGRLADKAGQAPIVVLDYLQRIGGAGDMRQRIADACDSLHAFAEQYDCPVLAVSSVARGEGGGNYGALLVDKWSRAASDYAGMGKESGQIEYSAQTVTAIVHQKHTDTDSPGYVETRLAIAASRRGPTRWVKGLVFSGWWHQDTNSGSDFGQT
jgi:replicative DNA helicase